MNKDFHYYGTYLAALGAGFPANDARKIAWASQMTDDCTESLLDDTAGSDTWRHRVATCQSMTELARSNIHSMSGPDSAELKKVRNIWMPFHFLPGNIPVGNAQAGQLGERYQYTGERTWGASTYDPSRDDADFQCICLHNSELVYQMVDDMISRYSGPSTRDLMLYLVGIRMHVLADTWAHEYFAGTPNYWVNEVEEMKQLEGDSIRPGAAPGGVSFYSLFYLGHGQAGHYPDYGYIAYHFRPHWMGKNAMLLKNNPAAFHSAFCQMLDAMQAIRTNGPFPRGREYDIPSDTTSVYVPAYGITAQDILTVVQTAAEDQTSEWKRLLTARGVVQNNAAVMAAFDYRTDDPLYSLKDFCECAEIHRNLVARYLEQNVAGIRL